MGLFLRQDEQRSEVQQRVAAEMQERLRKSSLEKQKDVEPAFLENQHTTRKAGMIIIVLVGLLCVAVVVYAIRIS
jgi:cell division protein FtsX